MNDLNDEKDKLRQWFLHTRFPADGVLNECVILDMFPELITHRVVHHLLIGMKYALRIFNEDSYYIIQKYFTVF